MSVNSVFLMWLFVALAAAGFVLLFVVIFSLIKTLERSILLTVPLAAESALQFDFAGKVDLFLKAPMFSIGLGFFKYEIINRKTEQPIRTRRGFPMQASTSDMARILQRVVFVPEPGEYLLRVARLNSQRDYSKCSIVFARPYTARIMLHVAALLLTGCMFIAGLVLAMIASQNQL